MLVEVIGEKQCGDQQDPYYDEKFQPQIPPVRLFFPGGFFE